jgi:hypothetical protein
LSRAADKLDLVSRNAELPGQPPGQRAVRTPVDRRCRRFYLDSSIVDRLSLLCSRSRMHAQVQE